jgi:hypothetical protein
MKTIIPLLSILWLISTQLQAVQLRNDNRGNVLILPFFTTENNWDSLINITAGGGQSVILKLRIRDSIDGNEINSFNIYTLPDESWRVSISKDVNNNAVLRIAEGNCTIDNNLDYGGSGTEFTLNANMGTIEVYAIGAQSFLSSTTTDCSEIANRWKPQGIWLSNPLDSLFERRAPLISAEMTLVNVEKGLAASYTATALHQFKDNLEDRIAHTSPLDPSPNLAEANPVATLENGVDVIPQSGEAIDAIAIILSPIGRSSITNDVVTEDIIAASTDWVISYPLDGYKNYRPFTVIIDDNERHCETFNLPRVDGEPFVENTLDDPNAGLFSWGQAINNDQRGQATPLDPPPLEKVSVLLCNSVNVISFNDKPSILEPADSPNLTNLSDVTASESSMLTMGFVRPLFPGADVRLTRSVLGFRLTTFVNGTLDGGKVLANYAVIKPHLR